MCGMACARQARSWLKHKASAQAYAQLAAESGLDLVGMRSAIKAGRTRRSAAVSFDGLCAEFNTDVHGIREARPRWGRTARVCRSLLGFLVRFCAWGFPVVM